MKLVWILSLLLLLGLSICTTGIEDNEFAEFEDYNCRLYYCYCFHDDEPITEATIEKEEEVTTTASPVKDTKINNEFDDEDYGIEGDDEELDLGDSKSDGNMKTAQPLKFADVPAHFRSNWGSYQVEAIIIFLLLVYMTNYLAGRNSNQAIAFSWVDSHREMLDEQFSVVGDDGLSEVPSSGQLQRETDNVFSMWCTGRAGVQGCMIHIRTIKRHDMVSRLWAYFNRSYDRVTLTFEVDPGEIDTFVIAAGQKKAVNRLHKDLLDLSQYTVEKKMPSGPLQLPSGFIQVSESSEVSNSLLDPTVVALMKKYEDSIEYVHISDQYAGQKPPDGEQLTVLPISRRIAGFSFILDDSNDREGQAEMLQMVFYILEKMRRFRLSREAKMKADKRRQAAIEIFMKTNHQARQEAAQARREEKTRERKMKLLEEEDPEKQRRLEKMEYKREQKAKQPKMKQLKMK